MKLRFRTPSRIIFTGFTVYFHHFLLQFLHIIASIVFLYFTMRFPCASLDDDDDDMTKQRKSLHFTQARENGSEWKVKMGTADKPSLSVAWCFICILCGYFLSLHLHSSGFIEKWPFMCGKLDVLALIKNIKKPCKAELSYTSML